MKKKVLETCEWNNMADILKLMKWNAINKQHCSILSMIQECSTWKLICIVYLPIMIGLIKGSCYSGVSTSVSLNFFTFFFIRTPLSLRTHIYISKDSNETSIVLILAAVWFKKWLMFHFLLSFSCITQETENIQHKKQNIFSKQKVP